MRQRGISTIISCQNEESLVAASILSFLPLSDEIVVVDNGSTDKTKEIAQEVADAFPKKVKFFDAPHLEHLYENRQYGFQRTAYNWIIRADADYICYTDGTYNSLKLRKFLLNGWFPPIPVRICLRQPNVIGDFLHTFSSDRPKGFNKVLSGPQERVYKYYPGMKFLRLGRWEGVNLPKKFTYKVMFPEPIWMHCHIKSKYNYLFRAHRTDWREIGDFVNYPTLESYISKEILPRYRVDTIEEAANIHFDEHIIKYIRPYNCKEYYPYPRLATVIMNDGSGYRIEGNRKERYRRRYDGPPKTTSLIDVAKQILDAYNS